MIYSKRDRTPSIAICIQSVHEIDVENDVASEGTHHEVVRAGDLAKSGSPYKTNFHAVWVNISDTNSINDCVVGFIDRIMNNSNLISIVRNNKFICWIEIIRTDDIPYGDIYLEPRTLGIISALRLGFGVIHL